jgi:type I restriction enzyme, S subunit
MKKSWRSKAMAGEWTQLRLGDVCLKIGSGATPRGGSQVYLEHGPFALIRSQNVYNDGFHREGLAYISEKHAAELDGVEVLKNDVLLNITGDSVARACQVDPGVLPARVNQHVAIIRPDPEKIDPRFLRYALISPDMQAKLLSWAGAGGTRKALTKAMIESLQVVSPKDIGEQRAIAHILGTLDDKIELNRRISETLEAMARALFKAWFADFDPVRAKMEGRWQRGQSLPGLPAHLYDLFPDRLVDSELGEIPEGWEVAKLGELLELAYGKALKEEDRQDGTIPVYGSNGQVGWHNEKLVTGPGIIVGRKGNPGVVKWVPTDFFPIDTTFYVVPKDKCPSLSFLFYALERQDLASLSADSAVPGLNRNLAYMSSQILPPRTVLVAFDSAVQPLFQRTYESERESRTLAALRDALLPKLISGELRVKDAERFLKERGL